MSIPWLEIGLFHQNLCRTGITGAFDTHHVVALVQVSEINALGSGHRFGEGFYHMTHQVEYLHANHRWFRQHHRQFVIGVTKIEARLSSHDSRSLFTARCLWRFFAARRFRFIGCRGTAFGRRTTFRLNHFGTGTCSFRTRRRNLFGTRRFFYGRGTCDTARRLSRARRSNIRR